MNFEQPPKPSSEAKDEKPEFFAGAKKNRDGTIDQSRAAKLILTDEEVEKLQKRIEDNKRKEEIERSLGFEWERSLQERFDYLAVKDRLSEHGQYEIDKLRHALNALRKFEQSKKQKTH